MAAAVGTAIDNAHLYESSRTRQAWIEATRDIATEFLAGTDPDRVLANVVTHARTLTQSERALLAVTDHRSPRTRPEEVTELRIARWSSPEDGPTTTVVKTVDTAIGRAFAERTPLRFDASSGSSPPVSVSRARSPGHTLPKSGNVSRM
ncbi:hypothetical protein ACFQUY_37385 [Nocardia tengchongensis]